MFGGCNNLRRSKATFLFKTSLDDFASSTVSLLEKDGKAVEMEGGDSFFIPLYFSMGVGRFPELEYKDLREREEELIGFTGEDALHVFDKITWTWSKYTQLGGLKSNKQT